MSKTVFVGLSGGVDSAVSAALLKERGYRVVGAFIKIWRPEFTECTWSEDRLDAMRVAVALDIPFREIDLSEAYKKDVVDTMVRDYAAGITPNPDVLCNQYVKFGAFAQWAFAEGADLVATGHYARTENQNGVSVLLRGIDTNKDQSYFLYRIAQSELARALFPVGSLTKPEVRAHAARLKLPVAQKSDSQGICFIGDVSMRDALRTFIPVEDGAVLDMSGKTIGTHEGAALYTIGQRHGFTVDGAQAKVPHYVVHIDVSHNQIVVSPHRMDAARESVKLVDVHWISEAPAQVHVHIQTRYRETPHAAEIVMHGTEIEVRFAEPCIASPGQSLVIYDGDRCLGGGIIARA